jgi:hypothetical protein
MIKLLVFSWRYLFLLFLQAIFTPHQAEPLADWLQYKYQTVTTAVFITGRLALLFLLSSITRFTNSIGPISGQWGHFDDEILQKRTVEERGIHLFKDFIYRPEWEKMALPTRFCFKKAVRETWSPVKTVI